MTGLPLSRALDTPSVAKAPLGYLSGTHLSWCLKRLSNPFWVCPGDTQDYVELGWLSG